MKILAIATSLRRNGNTARLVRLLEAELVAAAEARGRPLNLETLHAADLHIEPCRGCRACFDRGEDACPLDDDIAAITAKIRAADGLLLASPIYINDVNGVAKNLLDRLSFMCHRPELAETCFAAVTTVAGSPGAHALRTLTLAARTWGATVVGSANFKVGALMPQDEIAARYPKEIATIARRLVGAVADHRYRRPSFINLMMFRIQQSTWQQEAPDTLDYAYWHDRGWLDLKRTYYTDIDPAPLKVALARLTGAALTRFVA